MAAASGHNAELVDKLVDAVIGSCQTTASERLHALRHAAHEELGASGSGSTSSNPFAVSAQIRGLAEKARVHSHAELANALDARVDELQERHVRWAPECLALLLGLADRPVEKTVVEDLETCQRPAPPAELTWADILRDDPLDNRTGLWDEVDFADDSSVDDCGSASAAASPSSIAAASGTSWDCTSLPLLPDSDLEAPPDYELVSKLRETRRELSAPESIESAGSPTITEHQLIRDTIFMLMGLPTDLYVEYLGQPRPKAGIRIENVSVPLLQAILTDLTAIGLRVSVIRDWTKERERIPFVQAFQSSVEAELRAFDLVLSKIESQILKPTHLPVTLLTVLTSIQNAAQQLSSLAVIVAGNKDRDKDKSFTILESLYDLVCKNQALGSLSAYEFTVQVFFKSFMTYIKPMRLWMTRGEIEDDDDGVFFIRRAKGIQPLTSLWSDRFSLIYDGDGALHAPKFLHLAAEKILTTGKSVNFLRALGHNIDASSNLHSTFDESNLSLGHDPLGLQPFNELFGSAFDSWISTMHRSFSLRLKETLQSRCGLLSNLNAFEYVFFSRDGASFNEASDAIFDRIDRELPTWNNSSFATNSFQEAFAQIRCVDGHRLNLRYIENEFYQKLSLRSIHKLGGFEISYEPPWPIANIVKPQTLHSYRKIAVFLLQTRRAKQVLAKDATMNKLREGNYSALPGCAILRSLHHRLQWFVDTLSTYLKDTVLASTSRKFAEELTHASDVNDLIECHALFMAKIEIATLVARKFSSTHQAVTALLDLAVLFSDTSSTLDKVRHHRQTTSRVHEGVLRDPAFQEESKDELKSTGDDLLNTAHESILIKKIEKHVTTYDRLLGFALAGIREASRSERDPCLQILTESLALGYKIYK